MVVTENVLFLFIYVVVKNAFVVAVYNHCCEIKLLQLEVLLLLLITIADMLYTTIGCHPTRCSDFERHSDPEGYMGNLLKIAAQYKDKIVAVGEFGLGK